MLLHIGWLTTLLLGALGLVMGGAYLLELPVRMEYGPHLYMQVTSTLYRFFGLVGGPIQVLALLLSIGLVWRIRGRAAFASTLVGTLGFALSLLLWFLLVQPVNAAWADALRAGPDAAVQAYAQLRTRWELGHVAAFTAWLLGFIMLLHGVAGSPRIAPPCVWKPLPSAGRGCTRPGIGRACDAPRVSSRSSTGRMAGRTPWPTRGGRCETDGHEPGPGRILRCRGRTPAG